MDEAVMGPHSTHDGDGVGETPYYTTGYRYSRISILHPGPEVELASCSPHP